MIIYIFPLILFAFSEEVLGKKCHEGLRPHESEGKRAEEYKKFVDCGVSDKYKQVECKESCYVTDFWINGVNDKPLTISSCGRLDKKGLTRKDACTAVCEKDVFLKEMNMEKVLKAHAKDPSKLSAECLKFLTNVDAISVAKCTEGLTECENKYCPDKAKAIPKEDCKTSPSKTTVASATVNPNQAGKSETTVASATVNPNQAGKSETTVASATVNSNDTGNATTSGGAKIIPALLSMSYFALTFAMKRCL